MIIFGDICLLFINLDGSIEMAVRSKKPKAVALVKWLSKEGVEKIQEDHQLAIQDHDNQITAIQYENVALQAQRDVYQTQLQRCIENITHLRARYVDYSRDPGKVNIVIIVRKHTTSANDKYHDLPCYISRIQRRKWYVNLKWFDWHFPDHEVIVKIDNPIIIHAFNWFEKDGHVQWRYNNFRLIDLTRRELYTMGVPVIFDIMIKPKIFMILWIERAVSTDFVVIP